MYDVTINCMHLHARERVSIVLQVSGLTADGAAQAQRIAELEAASSSLKEALSELEGVKGKQERALQDTRLEISSLKRQLDASEEALTSITSEVCAQMRFMVVEKREQNPGNGLPLSPGALAELHQDKNRCSIAG